MDDQIVPLCLSASPLSLGETDYIKQQNNLLSYRNLTPSLFSREGGGGYILKRKNY